MYLHIGILIPFAVLAGFGIYDVIHTTIVIVKWIKRGGLTKDKS